MNPRTNISALTALTLLAGVNPVQAEDPYASLPSQVTLVGTVRDFKGRDQSGGHTDFEWQPSGGYAHYVGEAADTLDSSGLPQFASGGYKVSTEWKDSAGNNIINPKPYITVKPGDRGGTKASSTG